MLRSRFNLNLKGITNMDYELFWVNEMVTDNDEAIILLEA